MIRSSATELFQGAAAAGSWDFVQDIAEVLPGMVTLTLLGMDPGRRANFLDRMRRGIDHAGTSDPMILKEIAEDREWILAQLRSEIAERRRAPTDDLFSYLVNEPIGDTQLTDAEIIDIATLFLIGGFHTTSSAFSSIVLHLDQDRVHRQALINDPSLIPVAIEEIIRAYPAAMGMARTLTKDHAVNGATMRAGEKVLLSIASANRDDDVFSEPGTIEIQRDTTQSLAWGWGVHRCLGIHLARMILKAEVETLLEVMPNYVVDRARVRRAQDVAVSYLCTSIPASLSGAATAPSQVGAAAPSDAHGLPR